MHACACAIHVHVHLLAVFSHFFQLIRLVANLSIHPEVGPAVARDEDTVDYLLQILGEPMVLRELEREREREGGREGAGSGWERDERTTPHTFVSLLVHNAQSHARIHTHTYTGHMSLSDHPQLVINTLVTLNNLTYYSTSSDARNSSITTRQEEIAQCKLLFLSSPNPSSTMTHCC